ncbi:UDP-glucuronosyltransferase 2B33 [Blattella germanica]|nr:UDP-glucuronosyltransferase 2B33 [Blattella germanica]
MSEIFRDRPQTALESAIFWTEYVIRHGGAEHLRPAAVDMPLYQYLLLDVIAFITSILLCFIYIIYLFIKKCLNIFSRQEIHKAKKGKND